MTRAAAAATPEASQASTAVGEWQTGDIEQATAPERCSPVAVLPKNRQQVWHLGFINPNRTHPFFVQREAGMAAAADFYGVEYTGLDAKNDSSLNLLPDLEALAPDLVGSHNDVAAIATAAEKEKIPFLSVDLMPAQPGLTPYGVPNDQAGRMGADLLVQGVKERLASTWKDQEVFFIGLTASSIPACVDRITAAGQAVKAGLGLDEPHLLTIDASGTGGNPSSALLAGIDTHPGAVFALVPCWDQLGIDAYKTAAGVGFADRLLLVTLGGDQSNLQILKTRPAGYYGIVEFQPYCEGWSWVETAIAILEGLPSQPYQISRTVTQANVDARYAELYETQGP
jgi:ABC-type sugar transport system substrate-binding protein